MDKAGVSLKPRLPPRPASIQRLPESKLLCICSHPTEMCVGNREEEIPQNKEEGEVKGRAFYPLGSGVAASGAHAAPSFLPHLPRCLPCVLLQQHLPPLTCALTAPTSLCPGSATHPVLVGIDGGIANRPSKPGHIPRLQRENSTRNLTAALTLASCQPCLPSLPPPVLTLTASLCRRPPRRPGQEQT